MPGSSLYFCWKVIMSMTTDATISAAPITAAHWTNAVLSSSRTISVDVSERHTVSASQAVAQPKSVAWHRTCTPTLEGVTMIASLTSIASKVSVAGTTKLKLVRRELGHGG